MKNTNEICLKILNYSQCCQLLIVLEGIRIDGDELIARNVSGVYSISISISMSMSMMMMRMRLTFAWDSVHFWKPMPGFPQYCFSPAAFLIRCNQHEQEKEERITTATTNSQFFRIWGQLLRYSGQTQVPAVNCAWKCWQ